METDASTSKKNSPKPHPGHADVPNKRMNRHEVGTSRAKRVKTSLTEMPINAGHGYRMINFLTVFSALGEMIKCKSCDGNVTFSESSINGLGFKLVVSCENCDEPRYVNSCPLVNNIYEVNKRIVFATMLLGVGYERLTKFCGVMDLPRTIGKKLYDDIATDVHRATKSVADLVLSEAAAEEKRLITIANTGNAASGSTSVAVSHNRLLLKKKTDPSFMGHFFILIGSHSAKIIDLVGKLLRCEQCERWSEKRGTDEYATWKSSHECCVNNRNNQRQLMAVGEIFERSKELHGVKYEYIRDDAMSNNDAAKSQYCDNNNPALQICFDWSGAKGIVRNHKWRLDTLISSFLPKLCSDEVCIKTVEIAMYIAVSIFQKDYKSVLSMMHAMNIVIGPHAAAICEQEET